jgi:hypothetical protein
MEIGLRALTAAAVSARVEKEARKELARAQADRWVVDSG